MTVMIQRGRFNATASRRIPRFHGLSCPLWNKLHVVAVGGTLLLVSFRGVAGADKWRLRLGVAEDPFWCIPV